MRISGLHVSRCGPAGLVVWAGGMAGTGSVVGAPGRQEVSAQIPGPPMRVKIVCVEGTSRVLKREQSGQLDWAARAHSIVRSQSVIRLVDNTSPEAGGRNEKGRRFNCSESGTSFTRLHLFSHALICLQMAPYFLRNLVPKREKVERTRSLWQVLRSLTWTQWGLFFSGLAVSLTAPRPAECPHFAFRSRPPQVVSLDYRRHRLFLCLAHRCKFATAVQPLNA